MDNKIPGPEIANQAFEILQNVAEKAVDLASSVGRTVLKFLGVKPHSAEAPKRESRSAWID